MWTRRDWEIRTNFPPQIYEKRQKTIKLYESFWNMEWKSGKRAKGIQKGAKGNQKGAETEPNGTKREPKETKRERKESQKRTKRKPKGNQKATKIKWRQKLFWAPGFLMRIKNCGFRNHVCLGFEIRPTTIKQSMEKPIPNKQRKWYESGWTNKPKWLATSVIFELFTKAWFYENGFSHRKIWLWGVRVSRIDEQSIHTSSTNCFKHVWKTL